MTRVSLAGPRVGTVIMMRAVGDASAEGDAFTKAFHRALADTLRGKGYEPVPLYSGVFNEKIGGVTGSLNAFEHLREMRPKLQQPVFSKAEVRELAGVFVAWVEVRLKVPTYYQDQFGTRTTISGNAAAPAGDLYIEVFTPEGEPLVWANRGFWEWGTIQWTPVPGEAAEPGKEAVVGTYRVLSPEEVASPPVKDALHLLRPLAAQEKP